MTGSETGVRELREVMSDSLSLLTWNRKGHVHAGSTEGLRRSFEEGVRATEGAVRRAGHGPIERLSEDTKGTID